MLEANLAFKYFIFSLDTLVNIRAINPSQIRVLRRAVEGRCSYAQNFFDAKKEAELHSI